MSERDEIKAKVRKFIGGPELHIHDAGRFVDGLVDMVLDEAKPTIDDATVERAARALCSDGDPCADCQADVRAVLPAAVQEESAVKEPTVTKYDDWPQSIDQTCCGKCVGDGCYVDRLTGERE